MEPSADEMDSQERLVGFRGRLKKISLHSDSITGTARDILSVGNDPPVLKQYLDEWKKVGKFTTDASTVKALVYVMNEVIQNRHRENCPQILSVVNPYLTDLFADIASNYQSLVPSCNRVVQILRERNSCGQVETVYEGFRRALWGLLPKSQDLPPPPQEEVKSTEPLQDGPKEEESGTVGNCDGYLVRLVSEEPTSDDDITLRKEDEEFANDVTESLENCKKCTAAIRVKQQARLPLQDQVEKNAVELLPAGGGEAKPLDRASALLEARRKQVTRLLVKEWKYRIDLQEEYRELLAELQYRFDITIHRINQITTHKTVVQRARLLRL